MFILIFSQYQISDMCISHAQTKIRMSVRTQYKQMQKCTHVQTYLQIHTKQTNRHAEMMTLRDDDKQTDTQMEQHENTRVNAPINTINSYIQIYTHKNKYMHTYILIHKHARTFRKFRH